MSIEEQLNSNLKDAMRSKSADVIACIRSVKAKVQEAVTAKGFRGPVDDDLYRRVIASYVKSLKTGIAELEPAGERGRELRERYAAEIAYLEKYLPKLLGAEETAELVRQKIAELGVTDPKRSGQVVGAIMKDRKGDVDPALVKRFVEESLSRGQT